MANRCWWILLAPLLLCVGCNLTPKTNGPAAKGSAKIPKKDAGDFVDYLNRQTAAVRSVRYDEVTINATVPGQFVPALTNSMVVCSKPNHFRMTAGLGVGGNQLDVGSNPQEMWMYMRRARTPYVYCSQTDFPKLQDNLPVKFEPNWVMQALGLSTYDTTRQYTLSVNERDRTYVLSYPDVSTAGQRVLKTIEFAADAAYDSFPQVVRHTVLNEDTRALIAEARVTKVQVQKLARDPRTGIAIDAQIPTELTLDWPKEQVKLVMRLGKMTVNEEMTTDEFRTMFEKPRSIGSANPVNLAEFTEPRSGSPVPSRR